jgi:ribosomal protein S18 acetylase RimI-like enzyme
LIKKVSKNQVKKRQTPVLFMSSITLLPFHEGIIARSDLYELYSLLLREYIEPMFGWDEMFQQQRFAKEYPSHETFLVAHRATITGFIVLKCGSEEIHLSLLLLHPKFQSLGIGTRVMELVLAQAKSLKVSVTLSCFCQNYQALKFYGRFGFQTTYEDAHFVFLAIAP